MKILLTSEASLVFQQWKILLTAEASLVFFSAMTFCGTSAASPFFIEPKEEEEDEKEDKVEHEGEDE